MPSIGLNELRKRFLEFFESKGHLALPSFSLVPENDPSLLLINAGMTPLKPYFTGEQKPPRLRVTTCQKCIRTPDIENVGHTARHATFFEMLGNFSFGDYFKKEAITWAWEFFTVELKIPKEKLWITIYEDDDEAFEIWHKVIGLPEDRIVRMGKETNFWEHGTGPCGPCSEVHYDRGPDKGCGKADCKVGCECDRFIEVWNLVFTQFYRHENGEYTKLEKKNIDTGMGLERLATVIQDVGSLFEVDTIANILNAVCKLAKIKYGASHKNDVSIRVVTDHIRSTVFMVSDGIIPSNEGRGYVLRRLLRRASRHGRLLGIEAPFLSKLARVVMEESGSAYPELKEKWDYISKIIETEEAKFQTTIDQGLSMLESAIEEIKKEGIDTIYGEMAFKLHDTFGFPLDLTKEIASENGLKVDENRFKELMKEQKEKAREALKSKETSAWSRSGSEDYEEEGRTEFVGYNEVKAEGKALHLIKDGKAVEKASEGDRIMLISDKTPFYAESGGQVGDTGLISGSNGTMRVEDTIKNAGGQSLHVGVIENGTFNKGEAIHLTIDIKRRNSIAKNHTTTHLLHKALKDVLGKHVAQAGSMVGEDRLRFDFHHFTAMTPKKIERVEREVNEQIVTNKVVFKREMSLKDAKAMGAEALFGEKYGDIVRVIEVEDFSKELCGGTHLNNTAEAGLFVIISEGGVASGVRRIEAKTGEAAFAYLKEREELLKNISSTLKTGIEDAPGRIENLISEIHSLEKENEKLKMKLAVSNLDEVLSSAVEVAGLKVVKAKYDGMDIQTLRNTGDTLKNMLGSGVVILASTDESKVNLVVTASADAVKRGIHAGSIIKEAAAVVGGGGGGRPDMAQAGGKEAGHINQALETAMDVLKKQLEDKVGK
ncbi:MAG: alanine--tRNA ligase [Eubacteriales bacterium]|nr:alanine--tRNA ligase [Eubacteriales bacterium]